MQNYLKAIILMLPFLMLFTACTDEESELGLQLQDPNSLLNTSTYDTTRVVAYTFLQDSLKTSKVSPNLFGIYRDNVFGKVDASIFSQISLKDNKGLEIPATAILDSLVLTLEFSGTYPVNKIIKGNVHLQVYQLDEEMNPDSNYFSISTMKYKPTPLWDGNVWFNSTDSVVVGGEKYPPHVRIRLSDNFMNDIGRKTFTSNTDFVDYVKGLYIKIASNGAKEDEIAYFTLPSSTVSGMFLYYSGASDSVYRFIFDSKGARFTHFSQDYTSTPLAAFMNNRKDSVEGTSKVYLQTTGGTLLKVRFPDLLKWDGKNNYAINRATLILPVASDNPSSKNDLEKTEIVCYMGKSDGSLGTVVDLISGSSLLSVQYDESKNQYKIPLTRYIQRILNGVYEDLGLYIYIASSSVSANRVVLNGTNLSSNSMRLEIIYTK